MRPKRINGILLFIAAILCAGIFSCSNAPGAAQDDVKAVMPGGSVTAVVTATAEFKDFEYLIQSNGKIRSLREQTLTCEINGRLVTCNAQTGKKVASGAVILQLETTPIEYRLERAKLSVFNDQKEYESQLLGYENLLKDKSKEQSDAIKQKLRISTGLAGAEQDIKEANYDLTKATVKAPFSGVLADVKVQQGELLKAGDELFKLYDPANMLLEIKILEADIGLLKNGVIAEISPISEPGEKYNAVIYQINPYVDENGMVLVDLKIQHTGSNKIILFPGMNCTAVIKVPFGKTLIVPKEAVVMRSGKAVVFTLENGKAKWNYVITGRDNGTAIEIKEGLKAGGKVIVTNNLQLAEDAPVKEISPADIH